MDVKQIKDLVTFFEKTSLARLVIKEKNGFELTLEKKTWSHEEEQIHHFQVTSKQQKGMLSHHTPVGTPQQEPEKKKTVTDPDKMITSLMVGTFYSRPSPNSKPFVAVGDKVAKGDTVCIIEAMKVMNEIKAEKEGTISEVCVQDADPVEYGQPLFILE